MLAWTALGVGICASCSTQEPTGAKTDSVIRERQQRSTQLEFKVFQEALDAGAILGASRALYVGDRVRVEDVDDGWAAVSNTGSTLTRIGSDAQLGPIWSDAHLELRDRATIFGEAKAPSFSIGNQVEVQGGTSTSSRGPQVDLFEPFEDLPERQMDPIIVEPGQEAGLEPGKYGSLTVRARAKLWLNLEAYSFSNLIIEQGAQIITKSDCTPVLVQARDQLHLRGTVTEEGGDDPGVGIIVRYDGTQAAHVEQGFRGNVNAPQAELVLSSHTHAGTFLAKTLRVHSDAVIQEVAPFVPSEGQCGVGVDIGDPPVPTDIGPAPELSDPADLDTFLDWFYKITDAERDDAIQRISAVSPTSGIRQEVIDRLDAARDDAEVGHALMLLGLLGALPDPEVTPFLVDLVEEPITETEDPDSQITTPFDLEVTYRREALHILQKKGSAEAYATVKSVALSHPVRQLRKAAIRAMIFDQPSEVVEELREEIQPQDEFYLDMPNRSDPDFFDKLEAFRQKYSAN